MLVGTFVGRIDAEADAADVGAVVGSDDFAHSCRSASSRSEAV